MVKKGLTFSDELKLREIDLQRKKVYLVAQSAILMFFVYLLVGLVGVLKHFFSVLEFLLFLFMGVTILLIASQPYMKSIREELLYISQLKAKK